MHGDRFVIIGAGLTGGAAASTLRDEGFDGEIVLIGDELHPPYERPPLSKEYLRGEQPFEKGLLRPAEWYEQSGVRLLLGEKVERLDVSDHMVRLGGGGLVEYDRALIATGGRNRRLPAPGLQLAGVHDLRTVEDADAIRADAASGGTAVIVGAGFLGAEVAASLRTQGMAVEVIEMFDLPLERALGPDVGCILAAIHSDRGVRFHFGQTVQRFEGGSRVEGAVTDRGTRIPCDLAVVAVGIAPAAHVVSGTPIEVDNGILVDERCRTSVPDVFAAGDVANHLHPLFGRRIRVEHYDNALKQGAAAARSMMGRLEPFDDVHWFWTDQYEHNLQYVGHAPAWDDFVVRGSMKDRSFVGFYMKDGLVDAVVGLDRGRDVRRSARLVRLRQPVDPAALRDEDVDLKKLGEALVREGARSS